MMMASETFEVYQVNDVRCGKLDGKTRALQDTMPLHVDDLPDVRNAWVSSTILRARRRRTSRQALYRCAHDSSGGESKQRDVV
jgi:hypothetical protein